MVGINIFSLTRTAWKVDGTVITDVENCIPRKSCGCCRMMMLASPVAERSGRLPVKSGIRAIQSVDLTFQFAVGRLGRCTSFLMLLFIQTGNGQKTSPF